MLVTASSSFVIVGTGAWWLLIVPVVVAVVGPRAPRQWRVRVDDAGLTVRRPLGWPQYRVAARRRRVGGRDRTSCRSASSAATACGSAPGGRLGVVTRGGEALEVKRRDGRAIVVTVDDAGTAAGLLTALAARPAKG